MFLQYPTQVKPKYLLIKGIKMKNLISVLLVTLALVGLSACDSSTDQTHKGSSGRGAVN